MHQKDDSNKISDPASCDFCGCDRKLAAAFVVSYRNVGICDLCVVDCTTLMMQKLRGEPAAPATETRNGEGTTAS